MARRVEPFGGRSALLIVGVALVIAGLFWGKNAAFNERHDQQQAAVVKLPEPIPTSISCPSRANCDIVWNGFEVIALHERMDIQPRDRIEFSGHGAVVAIRQENVAIPIWGWNNVPEANKHLFRYHSSGRAPSMGVVIVHGGERCKPEVGRERVCGETYWEPWYPSSRVTTVVARSNRLWLFWNSVLHPGTYYSYARQQYIHVTGEVPLGAYRITVVRPDR